MSDFWARYRRNPSAMFGLVVVGAFLLIAVVGPYLAPADPFAVGQSTLLPPQSGFLMGTDSLGRDTWSQFIHGTRVSLVVGLLAAALGMLIGVVVGAISGYYGGRVDAFLMRVTEACQIMPRFILALVIVAMLGSGLEKVIIVIGALSWPSAARLIRAEFLSLKQHEFVEAARSVGVRPRAIIFREILPNALPPAIVIASLDVAQAILLEAGLSFLGIGDPAVMSWGTMLHEAQRFLSQAWWLALFPGAAIFLVVLGFNLMGDGINEAQNPRLGEN